MPSDYQAPLPESAQAVADVIGRSATLHLASYLRYDREQYSGSRTAKRIFYIPKKKRLTPDFWLVKVIGLDKAKLLQDQFGGSLLCLAHCHETLRGERNARIVNAYKAGRTDEEIAVMFGISARWVKDILYNTKHSAR